MKKSQNFYKIIKLFKNTIYCFTKKYKVTRRQNNGKNKNNHIISTAYGNQDFLGMAPVGENGVR